MKKLFLMAILRKRNISNVKININQQKIMNYEKECY